MVEKTIQRIKKLQALAERGVDTEKETAEYSCAVGRIIHGAISNHHLKWWLVTFASL